MSAPAHMTRDELVATWQKRLEEYDAQAERGRAFEIRRCIDELSSYLLTEALATVAQLNNASQGGR